MDNLGEEYLSTVIRRLKYYKELGESTFEQIEETSRREYAEPLDKFLN